MNLDISGEFRSALTKLKVQAAGTALRARIPAKRSALLQQIKLALERINQGTYGICHGCFLVIPRGELLTCPYTEYCARCRSRQVVQPVRSTRRLR